jgi:hypothetical protein
VSFATRLKTMGLGSLLSVAFYGIIGILFFLLLPFNNYPPHLGLTGILSLITAYGLFMKRFWAPWLVAAFVFVATTFSLVTLYFTLTSDLLVSLGLIVYVILTWLFTIYILNDRKKFET